MQKSVNTQGTDGGSVTVALPNGQAYFTHLVRDLYRALPTMPKPARRFAYNIIEQLENDILSAPRMGDHKLQDPKRLISWQLERFEQAMKAA